jgi:hypothetical protein
LILIDQVICSQQEITTMRVNDVIMTRMDGVSDRTVISAIIWITRSVSPLPCPKLTLMS